MAKRDPEYLLPSYKVMYSAVFTINTTVFIHRDTFFRALLLGDEKWLQFIFHINEILLIFIIPVQINTPLVVGFIRQNAMGK